MTRKTQSQSSDYFLSFCGPCSCDHLTNCRAEAGEADPTSGTNLRLPRLVLAISLACSRLLRACHVCAAPLLARSAWLPPSSCTSRVIGPRLHQHRLHARSVCTLALWLSPRCLCAFPHPISAFRVLALCVYRLPTSCPRDLRARPAATAIAPLVHLSGLSTTSRTRSYTCFSRARVVRTAGACRMAPSQSLCAHCSHACRVCAARGAVDPSAPRWVNLTRVQTRTTCVYPTFGAAQDELSALSACGALTPSWIAIGRLRGAGESPRQYSCPRARCRRSSRAAGSALCPRPVGVYVDVSPRSRSV